MAPSCTANGQSALMPIERSLSPLRSAMTASKAKSRRDLLVGRGNGHQALDRQPISLAAERDKGVGVLGKDARLLPFASSVDLDKQARAFADPVDFAGERHGDFFPVDRLDHVERLDCLARLVALQGPDQMKLDRLAERRGARPQVPPFGDRLLHAVLTEASLAGDCYRRPDLVGRECLGDGDELDRFGRPAAIAGAPLNLLAQRNETGRRVSRVVMLGRVGQPRLHRYSGRALATATAAPHCALKGNANSITARLKVMTLRGIVQLRRALAFCPKAAHEGRNFPSPTTASMGFKCGIVGLPNVGKSTLFNALTQTAAAQAANYPFCTIEPNVGDVAVPDPRLATLADIAGSKEIIPTRLSFVDIAGLVRGASKGEGLGNQFLANIRECDAIAHVVRCFEDGEVTHVEGRVDPLSTSPPLRPS